MGASMIPIGASSVVTSAGAVLSALAVCITFIAAVLASVANCQLKGLPGVGSDPSGCCVAAVSNV